MENDNNIIILYHTKGDFEVLSPSFSLTGDGK